MKLLLVCNAGMSTSMLVSKIESAAKDQGIDIEVAAYPLTQAEKVIDEWDVVMLGPQVRYLFNSLRKKVNSNIPITFINSSDYGTMNGNKILNQALELMDNKELSQNNL